MKPAIKDQAPTVVAAVVLAAGLSRRMGRDKLTLPWGDQTVIEQVLAALIPAGLAQICLVTGASHTALVTLLAERPQLAEPIRLIFNPDYANGEMTRSLQVGLAALPVAIEAALVVLGDQPQIEAQTVQAVLAAASPRRLVVPSYRQRRGHPWLLPRGFWPQVLDLRPPHTLRDFLNQNAAQIDYLDVQTDSVLRDLDTPEDYRTQKPGD